MIDLSGKKIWLGIGTLSGVLIAFFLRPAKLLKALCSGQNSKKRKTRLNNLTFAEKAQLILEMEKGEQQISAMKKLGMDLEWFPAPIDEVLECRKSIPYNALRQALDQGSMPVLVKRHPKKVLKLIDDGPWWKGVWLVEKEALLDIAKSNPELIIERIKKIENPLARYNFVRDTALYHLSKTSPQAAVEYAKNLPDSKAKRRVYELAMMKRAKRDPVGASEWLQNMPKGESRDGAISIFIITFRFENPGDAFIWATAIDNAKLRIQSLKKVVNVWLAQDSFGKVRRAVAISKLSQAERKLILQELSKPR